MSVNLFFSQAEGILRAWATPALQNQYGNDPAVTKLWNSTMTQVQGIVFSYSCYMCLELYI